MRLRRRSRFVDVAERQLALFAADNRELLAAIDAALRAYNGAGAEEAEERYAVYADLVDAARDELEALGDGYAATLDEASAQEYRAVFARVVRKRLPRLTLEPE
jgi:hypothetical protein